MDFSHKLYAAFADELANIASSDKEASRPLKILPDFARKHSEVVNTVAAAAVGWNPHTMGFADPEMAKNIMLHHTDRAISDRLKAFNKKAGLPRGLQRHISRLPREESGAVGRAVSYVDPAMDAFVKNPAIAAQLKQHQLGRDAGKSLAQARDEGGVRGFLKEKATRYIDIPRARRGLGG